MSTIVILKILGSVCLVAGTTGTVAAIVVKNINKTTEQDLKPNSSEVDNPQQNQDPISQLPEETETTTTKPAVDLTPKPIVPPTTYVSHETKHLKNSDKAFLYVAIKRTVATTIIENIKHINDNFQCKIQQHTFDCTISRLKSNITQQYEVGKHDDSVADASKVEKGRVFFQFTFNQDNWSKLLENNKHLVIAPKTKSPIIDSVRKALLVQIPILFAAHQNEKKLVTKTYYIVKATSSANFSNNQPQNEKQFSCLINGATPSTQTCYISDFTDNDHNSKESYDTLKFKSPSFKTVPTIKNDKYYLIKFDSKINVDESTKTSISVTENGKTATFDHVANAFHKDKTDYLFVF